MHTNVLELVYQSAIAKINNVFSLLTKEALGIEGSRNNTCGPYPDGTVKRSSDSVLCIIHGTIYLS